jgi:uncharacterized protein YecT (DUF1311 family)
MIWLLVAMAEPTFDAEVQACTALPDPPMLTFCLSERELKRADARLNSQWKVTFPRVRALKGKKVAAQFRQNQRKWSRKSEAECEMIYPDAPPSQRARNFFSCMTERTNLRTAYLRKLTGKL